MLETEPQIIEDYVETGQVKMIFSPILDFGPSLRSTEAAYCAGDQGQFWEMHHLLYERQSELWGSDLDGVLAGLARELGLDETSFESCLHDRTHAEAIQRQDRLARDSGVRVRPSFRLGERRIEGALPYPQFRQALEEAVAAAE